MAKQVGKYEIGHPLGEGQFGKVKEAVDLETGLRCAIKIIRKAAIKTGKDVETVKKEVQFMKMLDHPNVLKMYDTLEDAEKLYLVLEIAAGGDLFDKIVSACSPSIPKLASHYQRSNPIHGSPDCPRKPLAWTRLSTTHMSNVA